MKKISAPHFREPIKIARRGYRQKEVKEGLSEFGSRRAPS